jgi:hypothetical protein
VNNGGCILRKKKIDSLKEDLFCDTDGNIYYKTMKFKEPGEFEPIFISRLFNGCEGDSSFDLKKNIDIETFKKLGNGYYIDKKNVFYHNSMSDGGNIEIVENADIKTFRLLRNSEYSIDKKLVYYKGSIVALADVKTFNPILKIQNGDTTLTNIGKDKRYFYSGYDTCSKSEIEKQK